MLSTKNETVESLYASIFGQAIAWKDMHLNCNVPVVFSLESFCPLQGSQGVSVTLSLKSTAANLFRIIFFPPKTSMDDNKIRKISSERSPLA